MTYVLKNANLLGVFSWAINIPMIIGLLFTPVLVAKFGGMYKLNLMGYTLGTIGRLDHAVARGFSVPVFLDSFHNFPHGCKTGIPYNKMIGTSGRNYDP